MSSSIIGRNLGKYEIVELLGMGGMATVYKGFQADVERFVAVKVLPPHPGQASQFVERFQIEAKTIGRLQHPHILPVYDFGVEDDIFYLVMQFVEGGSLDDRIKNGPMPPAEIETLLRQMASAIDYAHRQGVIHRDIKPENILLDREGHALLADFGIVKLVGGDTNLTGTGALVGTPAYMAPETGQGEIPTPQADIYALGVVVFEMLTGVQPYKGDTPLQVVLKHVSEPVPSILDRGIDVPEAMENVIYRVLAKEPDKRFQTALAFAESFARTLHTTGTFESMQGLYQSSPRESAETMTSVRAESSPGFSTTQLPTGETALVLKPGSTRWLAAAGFAVIALLVAIVALLVLDSVGGTDPDEATPQATPSTAVAAVNTIPAVPTFGRVAFTMNDNPGDTINIQVQNLQPPGNGQVYAAWLLHTGDDSLLSVGEVSVDALGNGVLTFADPDGRTLPALYNAIAISLENDLGETPVGSMVYSGSVPVELTTALREILVSSPEGLDGEDSLLESALTEADTGSSHANNAFNSADRNTIGGVHTHAEHVINIYLGTKDDYDGSGSGSTPGREYGVVHPLELIEERLVSVLNAPETTLAVQRQVELIFPCIDNSRQRIDQVLALNRDLVVAEDAVAVLPDATTARDVAIDIINGVDSNENGTVEGFEGECGLQQIAQFGVLVGSIDIVEGPLS